MRARPVGRRIVVGKQDVLVLGQYEVDATILAQMLDPRNRVLWATLECDGRLQCIPYDETRCIWLTDDDLVRTNKDI
jgi:hypothetical protein